MATIFKELTVNDMHTDTIKTTTGLFTGGSGTLNASSMATASISSSNTSYFYTVTEYSGSGATNVFDIAYGHIGSSGSSATDNKYATKAVYKQFANTILFPSTDPDSKFSFTNNMSSSAASTSQDDIFVFSVKSDITKDRLDDKWTITLSGSDAVGSGSTLHLTNHTSSVFYDKSIAGPYYKVVSGSIGVPYTSSAVDQTVYGNFYPEISTIIFSANQLSASLPGTAGYIGSGSNAGYYTGVGEGFAPDPDTDGTADNAGKFLDILFNSGSSVVMRSEQDINQTTYYCRMFHNEFNFTSNPTFLVSGSTLGDIRAEMVGDPSVYVTTVGLYNSSQELIAVAKLNEAQKKNFSTEVTIAAKVDG